MDGFCHGCLGLCLGGGDDGHSGSHGAIVELCAEHGGSQPDRGDAIAVRAGNAFDEAVQAQSAQVIGDLARGELVWFFAEELGEMRAKILVGEGALDEEKEKHDVEKPLDARIGKAQGGAVAVVGGDGLL